MKVYQRLFFLFVSLIIAIQGFANIASPCCQPTCVPDYYTLPGDWFTRVRALYIIPNDSSDSISSIPNSGVGVRHSWTGEFDIGCMFTKHLGSELILATSYHSLYGKRSLEGTKIGSVLLLPPTLTLQWRFLPCSRIQPYVGGGVNYTLFYGSDCDLANTRLKFTHSWGGAVQGGVDFFFCRKWFFNLDLKYVWIDTKVDLKGAVNGHVYVDVDPWILGIGIGRKW